MVSMLEARTRLYSAFVATEEERLTRPALWGELVHALTGGTCAVPPSMSASAAFRGTLQRPLIWNNGRGKSPRSMER